MHTIIDSSHTSTSVFEGGEGIHTAADCLIAMMGGRRAIFTVDTDKGKDGVSGIGVIASRSRRENVWDTLFALIGARAGGVRENGRRRVRERGMMGSSD